MALLPVNTVCSAVEWLVSGKLATGCGGQEAQVVCVALTGSRVVKLVTTVGSVEVWCISLMVMWDLLICTTIRQGIQ